jgi:hypothetical protein
VDHFVLEVMHFYFRNLFIINIFVMFLYFYLRWRTLVRIYARFV